MFLWIPIWLWETLSNNSEVHEAHKATPLSFLSRTILRWFLLSSFHQINLDSSLSFSLFFFLFACFFFLLILSIAVTYTSYKKTPPPVPPRTTSKPLISVTAQSSTESTQDAYHDSRTQRISPWPQDGRGMYNSTDSLDSNKAMNLALETAAAQRHAAESQSTSIRTSDKAILVTKAEEFLKSRRSSIGIQVVYH